MPMSFQYLSQVLAGAVSPQKKIKAIRIEKAEVKLSLAADDMALEMSNILLENF